MLPQSGCDSHNCLETWLSDSVAARCKIGEQLATNFRTIDQAHNFTICGITPCDGDLLGDGFDFILAGFHFASVKFNFSAFTYVSQLP